MKIHVEFNSIAEMVNFSKFAGNDLVQIPLSKKQEQSENSYKSAYERTNANLERAYERLRAMYDNEAIRKVIEQQEMKAIDEEHDKREKERKEAIENDERFNFTVRAYNVFKCANIKTLKDLLNYTEAELMKEPNMGKLTMKDIKAELAKANLKLKRASKK